MSSSRYTFPPSNAPRTWLITAAASPLGVRLSKVLLDHGDNLVLGVDPIELDYLTSISSGSAVYLAGSSGKQSGGQITGKGYISTEGDARGWEGRARVFADFISEEVEAKEREARIKIVGLSSRIVGQCQAAVAQAVSTFGSLDVLLCCASEAVIGTVEELAQTERTRSLMREQFDANFFGPMNCIKAAIPAMRERKNGHIIPLSGLTSHLGTPGLGAFCSSGWALGGFIDSLAYEIAPFNIKITIVQPNYEVLVLSNKISAAPVLPAYSAMAHPAPLARTMMGRLIDRIEGIPPPPPSAADKRFSMEHHTAASNADDDEVLSDRASSHDSSSPTSPSAPNGGRRASSFADPAANRHTSFSDAGAVTSLYPKLPESMLDALLAETIAALVAIGGHDNPPARHIVGSEGIATVKERLKTVSEELEDFFECSGAVDFEVSGDKSGAADEAKDGH